MLFCFRIQGANFLAGQVHGHVTTVFQHESGQICWRKRFFSQLTKGLTAAVIFAEFTKRAGRANEQQGLLQDSRSSCMLCLLISLSCSTSDASFRVSVLLHLILTHALRT
jgi:hypothetical protein